MEFKFDGKWYTGTREEIIDTLGLVTIGDVKMSGTLSFGGKFLGTLSYDGVDYKLVSCQVDGVKYALLKEVKKSVLYSVLVNGQYTMTGDKENLTKAVKEEIMDNCCITDTGVNVLGYNLGVDGLLDNLVEQILSINNIE